MAGCGHDDGFWNFQSCKEGDSSCANVMVGVVT